MSNKKRKQKAARVARKKRKKDAVAEALRPEVEKSWNSYAENWSEHADHFRLDGHYDWMAGFLKQFHRVLEIGTGDGSGTVALAHNGSTVVSVDHNPKCQDVAEARLANEGVSAKRERRGRINAIGQGYLMTYSKPTSVIIDCEVLLLEGDVGNDDDMELSEWLLASPKFDAIACWNIGTYTALHQSFGTPQEYRLRTQNVVYELAESILRPDGVLHIIDRGQAPTDTSLATCIQGILECHRDQASVTSLVVDSTPVDPRHYVQPPEDTDIVMKRQDDTGIFEVEVGEMAFWSILARKP